jgi:cation transport ATPase
MAFRSECDPRVRSIRRRAPLAELAKLLPSHAVRIIRDPSGEDGMDDVPLTALQDGELVIVKPGARMGRWP